MNIPYKLIPLLLFLFIANSFFAQISITGTVTDSDQKPLSGASIFLPGAGKHALSDVAGNFMIEDIAPGVYELNISFLGFKNYKKIIELKDQSTRFDIQLAPDPLELDGIIVTGTFVERSKLESSVAIATLSQEDMQMRAARGTADLLKAIPGTFTDASAGEVFTRVYSRGISISAEDDIGWYYVSLQEDGLPITNYHTTYYGPDLFHRVDLTTKRLEAIRGGSAAVTSANAPGGIFNFISKTGTNQFEGEVLLGGALQGEGNSLYRMDANIGGPISTNGWSYNLGGFYRRDDGPREIDFNWSDGGQLKFNVLKTFNKGYLKFYGKYLNDKVNRYNGLAATNWENPEAAFGQDFNHSALMLEELDTRIADGRSANTTYAFNPDNGIHTKDLAFGFDFLYATKSDWIFKAKLKISYKDADWQTSIANQPLGLEEFTPYLLNGISPFFDVIPLGQIVFREARSQEVLARVNNTGILGPFMGEPASFEYLEGSLPNDALMGTAPWKKTDQADEAMEQVTVNKRLGNHFLTAGYYGSFSDVTSFTSASFAYATYEPLPRMLQVTLENPGEPVIELSDPTGISNYGGLLYNHGNAKATQNAFFLSDNWRATEQLTFDGGLRYELVTHKGEKDRFAPTFAPGGIDGQMETAYNNSVLLATGDVDDFDFKYDYLSWSLGVNYRLNEATSVFGRFSNGHKSPELNYYFNNFQNIPISTKGTVQDVLQAEAGLKLNAEKFTLFTTAFWSQLDQVAFSEFVLDEAGGGLFFTPVQFNKTTTIGLELEGIVSPVQHFNIRLLATVQDAKATDFAIYDANGTIEEGDDSINDFSGNELPHNPKVSFELSPQFEKDAFSAFFAWRFMGERQGNVSNGFQLPAFHLFNAGIGYELNKHLYFQLIANNIFNSTGLMNFFGPNEFGSNSNVATSEYIAQNPEASFVVFPVAPRTMMLRVGYRF